MLRRIYKLLLIFALLWPPSLWAAIALDGTPTGGTVTGGTSLSWAFTCTAGSAIVVSVGNLGGGALTISSVAYNSVTLDELNEADNSGGVEAKMGLYMAVTGCDGASHNVTVTLSGSTAGYIAGGAAAYSGVVTTNVSSAHRTVYTGGAGGGGGSVTVVDSQNGDVVVVGIANYSGTLAAGGNSRVLQNAVGGSAYAHGLQDYSASGANTSTSWTNSNYFTQMATALIPAAGGATCKGSLMLLGVGSC